MNHAKPRLTEAELDALSSPSNTDKWSYLMANILGGIAVSHTPTIGFAVDHHKQQDPAWAPIFQSFEPLQRWLEEKNRMRWCTSLMTM